MSVAVTSVNFTESSLSSQVVGEILERLIGYFLYSRGQIDKPIDQLRDDSQPTSRVKLKYAERSSEYKHKGNVLFATPIPCSVDNLTTEVERFSIFAQENETQEINTVPNVDNTPVRPQVAQKRRVLGKLQEVSIPVTPKLSHENNKYKTNVLYLLEVMDQIKTHVTSGWNINHLYLLLGPTSVSPKESYVIDISGVAITTDNKMQDGHSYRKYMMQIMQVLFINPFFADLATSLAQTNCYVLLSVTRPSQDSDLAVCSSHQSSVKMAQESQSPFFLPKLGYNPPKRGMRFDLVLKTSKTESVVADPVEFYMAPRPYRSCKSGAVKRPLKVADKNSLDILDTIRL